VLIRQVGSFGLIPLASSWIEARSLLENPSNRAVNVDVAKDHLYIIRDHLIIVDRLDLRRKVSVSNALRECHEITRIISQGNATEDFFEALAYIVQGGAIVLGPAREVMLRIVCDRNYIAKCPNFHVDKVDARGIVTILGQGTEYLLNNPGDINVDQVQQTSELDFLFMKGTTWKSQHYPHLFSWISNQQHNACWHRSPIDNKCHHRVIITVDACCNDEKEWLLTS